MAQDQYRLELDPPGYYRAVEPGIDWEVHGDELVKGVNQGQPLLKPDDRFYLVPDTQWLMPKPRQFDPGWYKSPDLADQVVYKDLWQFADGLNVIESPLTNVPGQSFPDNKWLTFSVPASGVTSVPLAVGLTNLFLACKLANVPSGVQVLARTKAVFNREQMPYLERLVYPEPTDFLLFGFGNLAFMIYHGYGFLLKCDDATTHQDWRMLATFNPNQIGTLTSSGISTVRNATHGGPAITIKGPATSQPIAFVPVGFHELAIGIEKAMHLARLRDPLSADTMPSPFQDGPMWIAGMVRQKIIMQVQVLRYHEAEHAIVGSPADRSATFMDLIGGAVGDDAYRPTEPVQIWTGHKVYYSKLGSLTYEELTGDNGDELEFDGYRLTDPITGAMLEVQAIDENNDPWISNGQHGQLALHLKLVPGSISMLSQPPGITGVTACMAPQLRLVQVKFDPVLVERNHSTTYLNENQFHSVEFELTLRDPNSKRCSFNLTDVGVSLLQSGNKFKRGDYPVHLTRDVDGDDSFSKLCLAFWVEGTSFEAHVFQGGNPDDEVRVWSVSGVGLMDRLEATPWLYLGMLTDPISQGKIKHTEVARQVLAGAGFDVNNAAKVVINDDPGPKDVQLLPGAPGTEDGVAGKREESAWQPEWDEGRGGYLNRIAALWRGWLLYEMLPGTIVYGEDLINVILDDCQALESELKLFMTHASAEDAGYPGQVYHEGEAEYQRPESNFVRTMGIDESGEPAPHVLDYVVNSVTGDPDTTDNFIGDFVRPITLAPKMALGEKAQRQIARMVLNHTRLGREIMKKGLPGQLPWNVFRYDASDEGLDVGVPCDLEGYEESQWLAIQLQGIMLARGIGHTVVSLERMPVVPEAPPDVGS